MTAIHYRLRVVSNFGDGDCGAGEIHTREREISRRRSPLVASPRNFARVCVYFARPTIAIANLFHYYYFPKVGTSHACGCLK